MYQNEFVVQERVRSFIYLVYGWMSIALTATAVVAYYVSTRPALYKLILGNTWALIGLFVAQLALVMGLSAFVMRMSYATAIALFMLYAGSLGLTLSSIFLVYKIGSIYTTFGVTAGTFATMCLYG
jgi:FtsH-binding integral membrane protein